MEIGVDIGGDGGRSRREIGGDRLEIGRPRMAIGAHLAPLSGQRCGEEVDDERQQMVLALFYSERCGGRGGRGCERGRGEGRERGARSEGLNRALEMRQGKAATEIRSRDEARQGGDSAVAISGNQWQGKAATRQWRLRSDGNRDPKPSEAIRNHPKPSEAIRSHPKRSHSPAAPSRTSEGVSDWLRPSCHMGNAVLGAAAAAAPFAAPLVGGAVLGAAAGLRLGGERGEGAGVGQGEGGGPCASSMASSSSSSNSEKSDSAAPARPPVEQVGGEGRGRSGKGRATPPRLPGRL